MDLSGYVKVPLSIVSLISDSSIQAEIKFCQQASISTSLNNLHFLLFNFPKTFFMSVSHYNPVPTSLSIGDFTKEI